MMVRTRNETHQDGTFHLSFFASLMGLDEQTMDIEVPGGESVMVDMACSEIVGFGSLETPGEIGCHLADGFGMMGPHMGG